MSFDGFDDNPDFFKIIEQFVKQLENAPGPFGEMFRTLKKQFENMDPEELNRMIRDQMSQGGLPFDLNKLISGNFNFFEMASNPEFMEKMQEFLKNANVKVEVHPVSQEKEAYFEIMEEENGGQLIVDLPGITDLRHVFWDIEEGVAKIYTINDTGDKYRCEVNFHRPIEFNEATVTLKHGVLTIPFQFMKDENFV